MSDESKTNSQADGAPGPPGPPGPPAQSSRPSRARFRSPSVAPPPPPPPPAPPHMGVSALPQAANHTRRRPSQTLLAAAPAPALAPATGILRMSVNKPRRSSGSSVEFRTPHYDGFIQVEPTSPQPSVDRLSVTFAAEERSVCSDSSVRVNVLPSSAAPQQPPIVANGLDTAADGVSFEEEEDYSVSMSAIMQRRASTRRSRRRSRRASRAAVRRLSSPAPPGPPGPPPQPVPFSPDADSARRSSVFTTSSADTGLSMEGPGSGSQEQILENLRLHKEVLSGVKMQPWGMRRKLRLVRQAKTYVKRHEGQLHERFAHSHATKDIAARFNLWMLKRWQRLRREVANLLNMMIPWELRIKEIESHFGSVVASYFTFLRWLCWVNLVIVVVITAFVAVPEILTADAKSAGERKEMLPEERDTATKFYTLWDFEGPLKYSPLFYGFYTDREGNNHGYRLPFAYFMTGLAVYVYSFVAILRKMASNSRMSKLSEKDDECVFTWKLFAGWDYMIGNSETAHNRVASTVLGFKEALLEEAEKQREERNWRVMIVRFSVNILVLGMLASSAYAVVLVVERSTAKDAESTLWRRNETTVVVNIVNFVFPLLFEVLGILERYHPRKTLRVQLARIMALNLINIYTLIFSMFQKINDMSIEMQKLMSNDTVNQTAVLKLTTVRPTSLPTNCFQAAVTCGTKSTAMVMFTLAVTRGLPTTLTSQPLPLTTASDVSSFISSYLQTTTPVTPATFTSPASWTPTTSPDPSSSGSSIGSSSSSDYSSLSSITLEELNGTSVSTEGAYGVYFGEQSLDMMGGDGLAVILEDSASGRSRREDDSDELLDDLSNTTTWLFEHNATGIHMWTSEDTSTASPEGSTSPALSSTESAETTETTASWSQADTTLRDLVSTLDTWTWRTSSSSATTSVRTGSNSTANIEVNASETCYVTKCDDAPLEPVLTTASSMSNHDLIDAYAKRSSKIDLKRRRLLRRLCWETMFGQELVKMTVMDLVMTIASTLLIDFFRAIFVRVMNNCWCWDLEKKFPQYGDFKIAENILHLVNNQGMVWMGMFFSPGLPLINLVKLAIMMYLRSWAVLTCNVPHEVVFRASRSNNFYLALLLTMLFLCVLPVGYAIVRLKPSWHCGPFSSYEHTSEIFTNSLRTLIPATLHDALDYMASPGIVIPLLLLLSLVIYYLVSLTNSLREANNDLKIQLRRERTEERRKMFQLVDGRRGGSGGDLADKWRKLTAALPTLPLPASGNADGKAQGDDAGSEAKPETNRRKELLNRLIKHALRKSSATSDEESVAPGVEAAQDGDATDAEQMPDDEVVKRKVNRTRSGQRVSDSHDQAGRARPQSPGSNSPHREREDSLVSAWSDVIPEIRISKTESSECVLEQPQTAEPQRPSKTGSSDTIVAAEDLAQRNGAR